MQLNNIEVTYCSNYNGCYLHAIVDGERVDLDTPEFAHKANECADEIVNLAVKECSEDGYFYGDIDQLAEFCVVTVKRIFGEHITVTFDEDSVSS